MRKKSVAKLVKNAIKVAWLHWFSVPANNSNNKVYSLTWAPKIGSERGMEVRRSWTREDLRDSLNAALYQGRVRPNDIPKKFNQVSRQRAQVPDTRIPPGLHFTNEDWSLLRAASELSGCSAFSHRLYTDAELRNALKAVHGKELTQKEALARFGPKVATIQKYLTELRKMLHTGFTLERALLALNFPSPGPHLLMPTRSIS